VTTDRHRIAAISAGGDRPVLPIEIIEPRVRHLERSEVTMGVEGTYTDRRRMENYDVLTGMRSGPLLATSDDYSSASDRKGPTGDARVLTSHLARSGAS
jgi:hypothetical protein